MSDTLQLMVIRELTLQQPSQAERPAYLAAASGLVQVGNFFYVVADDEMHLGVFPVASNAPGTLVRLFEGELPLDFTERKAHKPDLEVLVLLPAQTDYPHGALLALGSGSKKRRCRGAVLALTADGSIKGEPQIVDLTELYDELKQTFSDLNIEGGFIDGEYLHLLQRGNKSVATQNARITVKLTKLWKALRKEKPLSAKALVSIQPYSLGEIQDVPLCFTDAAVLPDGSWVFSAAAEATDNSYQDGEFVGAALGLVNAQGTVVQCHLLDATYKIEGVSVSVHENVLELHLVTDGDNPAQAAVLLKTQWLGYPFVD